MFQPLRGIRVVDCCLAGAGPSCTKLLQEQGADVIWVEALHGSSTRMVHKFDFYTAGKRSLALNLKTGEGREIMERLIKRADVFVSNYRPKARKKLGLDYESLRRWKPGLIYGELTGFGAGGEQADEPGYDPVAFWAKSGLLCDITEPGTLVVPPIAVGDITAGLSLAGGLVSALYNRDRTGEGCRVSVSLYGTAAYLNHDAAIETQYGEGYPKTRKAPRRALLNTYRCSDGKWIVITAVDRFEKHFWPLLRAVGREDLVGDPRWRSVEDTMYGRAPEVVAVLDEAFGGMTQDQAVAALRAIDFPVSRVQSSGEMLRDPQALENRFFFRRKATRPPPGGGAEGEILIPASPVKFNTPDSGTEEGGRGPRLGEHTAEVLAECGYTPDEIRGLAGQGVVMAMDSGGEQCYDEKEEIEDGRKTGDTP